MSAAALSGFEAFDQLATMVAVAGRDGHCVYANSALENAAAVSRSALRRGNVIDWFVEPQAMRDALHALQRDAVTTARFDAQMKRAPLGASEALPVRVSVSLTDSGERVLLEMVEIEQQARQEREERTLELVQANKELLRNLAHEVKNPLGGIRGAAQLLQMELAARAATPLRDTAAGGAGAAGNQAEDLSEYTQVIIHEADRLQTLVDRLLAPHRRPHVVGDVNIHEVCERVRSLVLAEFPRGLRVTRDYDTSVPEFRGDREQLIQAVLNIVHNAAQALSERIAQGDASIVFRTRIARQVTFGKQRYRLALELHVIDNGPGVPDSIKDRIFYPLVSGREGGSGLGLTLAQTFVQQHHGLIECESVPGRTDFKLLIPLP